MNCSGICLPLLLGVVLRPCDQDFLRVPVENADHGQSKSEPYSNLAPLTINSNQTPVNVLHIF